MCPLVTPRYLDGDSLDPGRTGVAPDPDARPVEVGLVRHAECLRVRCLHRLTQNRTSSDLGRL